MRSELWTRADRLLEAALDLPEAERDRFLLRSCRDEPALVDEVRSLLAADRAAGRFLVRPLATIEPPEEEDESGRTFGPYRLLRRIGSGGMGTVYLAERDDGQYRQRVALKVIRRPGLELELRLRTERQALARLEHPHIARLYDGGVTPDGRPYLVLEYVRGEPIDRYCDRHRLTIEARLELFRLVCLAVHHAHRNLLVHRDLKPSNILVDEDGMPKLLDFGIVKPLDATREPDSADLAAETTRTGVRPMTPGWASPEQVRGAPITTATDVHALGLLLHRLLSGRFPYSIRHDLPYETERRICEEPAERPSDSVARMRRAGELELAEIAGARSLRPRELRRRLRGDLDTIVGRALRKEPDRRYASALQLAEDVERHLAFRPVLASPDSKSYRLRKFLRRNARTAILGLAAVLALALFVGLTVAQSFRVERERRQAELERARAVEISSFLTELFENADPAAARGRELTVREVLDRGAERIELLAEQPLRQAMLHDLFGHVYCNLGLYEEARHHLEEALALRRRLLDDTDPEVAETLSELAHVAHTLGDSETAMAHHHQALAARRALYGDDHPSVAISLNDLALVHDARGDHRGAEALHREAIEIQRRILGEHPHLATSLANLAVVLARQGSYRAAEPLFHEALAMRRELLGEEHPEIASSLNDLGNYYRKQGEYARAEELLREALAMRRRLLGPEHPETATTVYNLAAVHEGRGDYEAAEPLYREALALDRKLLGEEHRFVAYSLNNLAFVLFHRGEHAAAEELLHRAGQLNRKLHESEHPLDATVLSNLGRVASAAGRHGEAETLQRRALAIRRRLFEGDHPTLAASQTQLGLALHWAGDPAAAEPWLREAVAMRERLFGQDHPKLAEALVGLARVLLAAGEEREAESIVRRASEILERRLPTGHWRCSEAATVLAGALATLGSHGEAASLLREHGPRLCERRGERAPECRAAKTFRTALGHAG